MSPIDRTGCSATRHGTASTYNYGCRCPDAREAWRLYSKRRRENRAQPGYTSPIPSARKVQALMALGWPAYEITRRLGWSNASSNLQRIPKRARIYRHHADAIDRVYRELSGTAGPSATTRRRAKTAGYLPPLAWDCIDTDSAPPETSENDEVEVDEIVVLRAASGRLPASEVRTEERRAAVARLAASGHRSWDIARLLSADYRTVLRDRNTLDSRRRSQRGVSA